MVVLSSCTNYDDQFDDLNSQLNTLKSQIDGLAAVSSGVTALQGTVSALQAAVAALPKTTTPATDISGLSSALTALAATVAELKASLATAATASEVAALADSLTKVQTDLSELLAMNNVYTGDVIINNAATLTAAEALGDKLGIVNGNVYITQTSTAIDAARLQVVASKFNTVTGAVSYTHTGTGVTAVDFTVLTSAGSVSLVQDAPISLPALTSTGVAVLKSNAAATKLTSVSAPLLTSVTSINNGSADSVGGTSVTSVDMGSLVRYPNGTLGISVSTTGDTTVDFASLTTTSGTTGLQQTLGITLTGGDDLTLPLVETGSVVASNVKTLVLPMLVFTGANVTTSNSKLETLALHKVDGLLTLTAYNNLSSIDIIGIVREASVANKSVNGSVAISGATTDLITASFAGTLVSVSIAGATDLTNVTTSGMIRSFSLDGSNDITSLTLGHAGITGVTGTSAATINNTNAGVLSITNNDNLVSFSATEIAHLGKLHITGNDELTSFDLKSTLGLGVQPSTGSEVVDVLITDNALTGSVQRASAYNVVPVVTGKITQASLNNIATYLKAVEVAISTPTPLVTTSLADTAGWDRTTGQYTGVVTSGGAVTGYTLTNADVEIDSLTANVDSAGTDAGASSDYKVIEVDTPGLTTVPPSETQAKISLTAAYGASTTITANGGSKAFTVAQATATADLAALQSDPIWATYGVSAIATAGANRSTFVTIAGTYSATDAITLQWAGASGTSSFTTTVTGNTSTTAQIATLMAADFNAYSLTNSDTTTAAKAVASGSVITIMTGSYSGTTTDLYITPTAGAYFPGIVGTISTTAGVNPTAVAPSVSQGSGYSVTISAVNSATGTLVAASGLGVTATGTGAFLVAATGAAHPIVTSAKQNAAGYNADRVYVAAVGATQADITKRSAWL
jgi:hypothetical protein